MCGIAGVLSRTVAHHSRGELQKMNDELHHRGPDGEGIWSDVDKGISLVHRRLALVDLTPSGKQPMISGSGRYVVTFNGEIYNYKSLHDKYRLQTLGGSDTAVICALFERFGIRHSLDLLAGMFSIAIWDRMKRELSLVRDRMGEKPLYYSVTQRSLESTCLFASELKGLRVHQSFVPEISSEGLEYYRRLGYVPSPLSIYRDVFKVEPGSIVTLRLREDSSISVEKDKYWSLSDRVNQLETADYSKGFNEAKRQYKETLYSVIREQMYSERDLGCFL